MAGIWTYSRDGEKLQIHHVEHEGKAELIVQGLGPTSRREFTSLEAILLYVTMLEGNLVAAGWYGKKSGRGFYVYDEKGQKSGRAV